MADINTTTLLLLCLPACINLWSIWHAATHSFPIQQERLLWIGLGVFFPVIGGVLYLILGLRRSKKV